MLYLRLTAILLVSAFWSASANAGFIRYDITFSAFSPEHGGVGFMLFEDMGEAGDIAAHLVDWEFYLPLPDFTYSPANTHLKDSSAFVVDIEGNILSDQMCFQGDATPCASTFFGPGISWFDEGSTAFWLPGGQPLGILGGPEYSEPLRVSVPGTGLLGALASFLLFATRLAGGRNRGRTLVKQ